MLRKTLFLAQIGKEPWKTDQPRRSAYRLPRLDAAVPTVEDDKPLFIDTHYYGGIKKHQWTTIPWRSTESSSRRRNRAQIHREDPSDPVLTITDLPHLGNDQAQTLGTAFR